MDVIADLALPVPSTVICEMMGVPAADREVHRMDLGRDAPARGAARRPRSRRARRRRGGQRSPTTSSDLIAERRRTPRDDILSDLIRAEEAGDRLSTRSCSRSRSGS